MPNYLITNNYIKESLPTFARMFDEFYHRVKDAL